MDTDILIGLGFSKNEAKAYLALLELGTATAGEIADKSKVHRTNVYDALERLNDRGLAAFVMKDGAKRFKATDPKNLKAILQEKEEQLDDLLPKLELVHRLSRGTGTVNVYEGIAGAKLMLDRFLDIGEPIVVYGVPKEALTMMESFIIHYHKRRIAKGIEMRHIYNEDARLRIDYLNSLPYTGAKYLPGEYDSPVATNVCGDHTVLILWKKDPLVIHIENAEIAASYRKYFELLWRIAT
ncbi:TrmB family transcriptional regulator [Candidatus Woesearchaeota archaeon]|nr:TrmB family transcriptional regulator [Candidatus Woesearchaeota archaeon]